MNKEDKELLFKDLCARLPYGVIVSPIDCGKAKLIGFQDDNPILFDLVSQKEYDKPWEIEYIKSYLRPMSSMTEEEINELKKLCTFYIPSDSKTIGFEDYGILVVTHHITNNTHSFKLNIQVIDWLNAHHFDYRGLIDKGIALEAPKGMYNI